ncbi:MAG: helix-turn-helix transcriptional regulator [Candidatus Dormibacteraceae bacterium]
MTPARLTRQTRQRPAGAATKQAIMETMEALVLALGRALGPDVEVVLHDLDRLPSSLVAISNPLTGRTVGDPPTDLLLRDVRAGRFQDRYRYAGSSARGTRLRSSTLFIRDPNGLPIATLCINRDVTELARLQKVLDRELHGAEAEPAEQAEQGRQEEPVTIAGPDGPPDAGAERTTESFAHGVPQLAELLIQRAIDDVGVPVELMKKPHKLLVVRDLEERGFFLIREAVEDAASALGVTRYTIYNYLNQLQSERDGAGPGAAPTKGP